MSPETIAPIRVFVVEDQTNILRNQLKLLGTSTELIIVGTALSGESALEEIAKVQPDVVLLDLGLPRMSGIEVTSTSRRATPKSRF